MQFLPKELEWWHLLSFSEAHLRRQKLWNALPFSVSQQIGSVDIVDRKDTYIGEHGEMWGTVCSEPSSSRTNALLLSGKFVRQSKTTYGRGGEKSQLVLFILRTEGSKTNQRDKGLTMSGQPKQKLGLLRDGPMPTPKNSFLLKCSACQGEAQVESEKCTLPCNIFPLLEDNYISRSLLTTVAV